MNTLTLLLLFYGLVFASTALLVGGVAGTVRAARRERHRLGQRLGLVSDRPAQPPSPTLLRRLPEEAGLVWRTLGPWPGRLAERIAQAGFTLPVGQFLGAMGAASAGLLVLGLLLAHSLTGAVSPGGVFLSVLLAAAIGLGLPLAALGWLRDRRVKRLEAQLPLALDVFVRGLRAGHPIAAALALLAEELPDPIGSEFRTAHDETAYGLDLRDALQNMAQRCGVADMHMFAVCIAVQNETGGNLAEILENLARVIRDRAAMVLKVRALSSEGRMTATMLTALPVLAFTGLFLANPAFYLDVAHDPAFFPAVAMLLGLYGVGVVTIRRLTDLKI